MRVLTGLVTTASLVFATSVIAKPHTVELDPKPAAVAPASANVLPVFSFMGQDTETIYTSSVLRPKCTPSESQCVETDINDISAPLRSLGQCSSINPIGQTECTNYNDPQVAGKSMQWVAMSYFNGKLYLVSGSAVKYAYADLLAAFSEKYGNPTSIKSEKWQARSGATFDNVVSRWNFKGGELVLNEIGLDLDRCSFEFNSVENSPPPDRPKIDF